MSKCEVLTGWSFPTLEKCADLNPKIDKSEIEDDKRVHFVAMPSVEALTNKIDVSEIRNFAAVKKGYTAFTSNDVLFAKITPCMENGKMVVVPELEYEVAFGSTEFHVIRPLGGIPSLWFFLFVSARSFRSEAEHNMTGAVGQRRVPITFLANSIFPLPPLDEQKRIVAKIEELFSELDAGVASLKQARTQLSTYRQSLLKQAFEGKLTAQWRRDHPEQLESPEQLLTRIQQEREIRYQQSLQTWQTAVENWEASGKAGKKPAKPKMPEEPESGIVISGIPRSWASTPIGRSTTETLIGLVRSSSLQKTAAPGFRYLKMDMIDMSGNVFTTPDVFVACSEFESKRFKLCVGDILFNTRNSVELVGKTGVIRSLSDKEVVYNNNLMRLRFPPSIDPYFINYQLVAPNFRKNLDTVKKATTSVAAIYGKDLWPLNIAIPPLPEQQEIVRLLEEQFTAIEQNEREIEASLRRAEALRQSILKRAFSGQLVPQDPTDEPAAQLLARIQQEKTEREAQAPKMTKKKATKKNTTKAKKS